jgi:hypothetical protein
MKTLAILLALCAGVAFAATCTTHTIYSPDGKMLQCTTCCDRKGNCTTQCI